MGKNIDRNRATKSAVLNRANAEASMNVAENAYAQNAAIRRHFGLFSQLVEMFAGTLVQNAEKAYRQAEDGPVCCFCGTPSDKEHPGSCPFSMALEVQKAIIQADKSMGIERSEGEESGIVIPEPDIVLP